VTSLPRTDSRDVFGSPTVQITAAPTVLEPAVVATEAPAPTVSTRGSR
jgi:hypothetical protein